MADNGNSALLEAATALNGEIRAQRLARYFDSEIPEPLDESISRLIDAYAAAPASQRAAAADAFQGSWQSLVLFAFAARMATLAVRLGHSQAVRRGLNALAFEGARNDWRDTLVYLAVVSDAAERLGLDFKAEIAAAAGVASTPEARDRFHEFASRPPDLRSLRAMGWRIVGSGETSKYESI
jgi:hypothetical protein